MFAQLVSARMLKEEALRLSRGCMHAGYRALSRRPVPHAEVRPGFETWHATLHDMLDFLEGLRGAIYARNPDYPRPVIRHEMPVASSDEIAQGLHRFAALCADSPDLVKRLGSLAAYFELPPPAPVAGEINQWRAFRGRLPTETARGPAS